MHHHGTAPSNDHGLRERVHPPKTRRRHETFANTSIQRVQVASKPRTDAPRPWTSPSQTKPSTTQRHRMSFDQALVFHGVTDYMRDYEMFIYATADLRTGIGQSTCGLFQYCVRASITSAVPP